MKSTLGEDNELWCKYSINQPLDNVLVPKSIVLDYIETVELQACEVICSYIKLYNSTMYNLQQGWE